MGDFQAQLTLLLLRHPLFLNVKHENPKFNPSPKQPEV
jgi:hypothetical protein